MQSRLTTSEIDEEAIFYMLARGIPKQVAQELLVYGFFEEGPESDRRRYPRRERTADDPVCKFHH